MTPGEESGGQVNARVVILCQCGMRVAVYVDVHPQVEAAIKALEKKCLDMKPGVVLDVWEAPDLTAEERLRIQAMEEWSAKHPSASIAVRSGETAVCPVCGANLGVY